MIYENQSLRQFLLVTNFINYLIAYTYTCFVQQNFGYVVRD